MPQLKVVISGGGTGGHIFPALAIADALKKVHPDADILFVGAKGRMEMERVPAAGYPIKGLWISGFQRKLTIDNLSFPFKVLSSVVKARSILKEFKPHAAIGVGGYASGPLLRMATALRIPSVIQEQNSFPGVTNRILAPKVDRICVAYEGMDRWFPKGKIVFTGNPLRPVISGKLPEKQTACAFFGLESTKPVLLVIGGSLGARTINQAIAAQLEAFAKKGYQLLWQTGKTYAEEATHLCESVGNPALKTLAFIDRMDMAYAAADVVVSRAGAMSVAELCAVGKPAILVPSPNVAEDHQTKNAMALVKKNAAILVSDKSAPIELAKAIDLLMNDQVRQSELRTAISAMAKRDAAEDIAAEILKLISL